MNLTFKSSLSTMLHKTAELEGVMKSQFEAAQDYSEALESLNMIQTQGRQLESFMTDLTIAQSSLESLGYSEEWFKMVNHDGNFLKAINVELTDLLGTAEEKGEICMEGLWDTIKSVLSRIWKFICDLIKRVANFLRSLMTILKTDVKNEQSVNQSIDELKKMCGAKAVNANEVWSNVGKKINEFCANNDAAGSGSANVTGGIPAYDRRDLLTRAFVSMFLSVSFARLVCLHLKTRDVNNIKSDADIYSEEMMKYFGSNQNQNYFFHVFVDLINKDPSQIVALSGMQPFEWRGFKTTQVTKDIKKISESVGLAVHEDGPAIVAIDDAMKTIDYSTVYKTEQDYHDVSNAASYILGKLAEGATEAVRQAKFLEDIAVATDKFVGKYDTIIKKNQTGDIITPDDEAGLSAANNRPEQQMYRLKMATQWTMAASQFVARMAQEAASCRAKIGTMALIFRNAVNAVKGEVDAQASK